MFTRAEKEAIIDGLNKTLIRPRRFLTNLVGLQSNDAVRIRKASVMPKEIGHHKKLTL